MFAFVSSIFGGEFAKSEKSREIKYQIRVRDEQRFKNLLQQSCEQIAQIVLNTCIDTDTDSAQFFVLSAENISGEHVDIDLDVRQDMKNLDFSKLDEKTLVENSQRIANDMLEAIFASFKASSLQKLNDEQSERQTSNLISSLLPQAMRTPAASVRDVFEQDQQVERLFLNEKEQIFASLNAVFTVNSFSQAIKTKLKQNISLQLSNISASDTLKIRIKSAQALDKVVELVKSSDIFVKILGALKSSETFTVDSKFEALVDNFHNKKHKREQIDENLSDITDSIGRSLIFILLPIAVVAVIGLIIFLFLYL